MLEETSWMTSAPPGSVTKVGTHKVHFTPLNLTKGLIVNYGEGLAVSYFQSKPISEVSWRVVHHQMSAIWTLCLSLTGSRGE